MTDEASNEPSTPAPTGPRTKVNRDAWVAYVNGTVPGTDGYRAAAPAPPGARGGSTPSALRRNRTALVAAALLAAAGAFVAFDIGLSSGSHATATTTTTTPNPRPVAAVSRSPRPSVPISDPQAQAAANALAVRSGCAASPTAPVNDEYWPAAPAMVIDRDASYVATVVTTAGTFTVALSPRSDPVTVNDFVFLARQGFYRCNIFNRVIPGFADQTGDPTSTGGPGYTIPDEDPPAASNPALQYPLGSVALSNSGTPGTGGSAFFIVAGPMGESLPNRYALFGHVVSGLPVVETINAEGSPTGSPPGVIQRILSVTVAESSAAT
jgi:cyclophilin family peptidyl-prolyl cis-trans isomerase